MSWYTKAPKRVEASVPKEAPQRREVVDGFETEGTKFRPGVSVKNALRSDMTEILARAQSQKCVEWGENTIFSF